MHAAAHLQLVAQGSRPVTGRQISQVSDLTSGAEVGRFGRGWPVKLRFDPPRPAD